MFEADVEITQAVENVYALTAALGRGDVLTHEAIAGALSLSPHEGRWDHIVGRVRRRLEAERGISTWPEHTVGYRLCSREEQLAIPLKRMKRAYRQVRRGRKSVEALPEAGLTFHQRRLKAFMVEHAKASEQGIRREAREQEAQLKPSETLPRRRPAAAVQAPQPEAAV